MKCAFHPAFLQIPFLFRLVTFAFCSHRLKLIILVVSDFMKVLHPWISLRDQRANRTWFCFFSDLNSHVDTELSFLIWWKRSFPSDQPNTKKKQKFKKNCWHFPKSWLERCRFFSLSLVLSVQLLKIWNSCSDFTRKLKRDSDSP